MCGKALRGDVEVSEKIFLEEDKSEQGNAQKQKDHERDTEEENEEKIAIALKKGQTDWRRPKAWVHDVLSSQGAQYSTRDRGV